MTKSKFPDRLSLPAEVYARRESRRRQILKTSLRGVSLRLVIILVEILGFWYWGSSSLLLDAVSSFLDIGVTGIFMLCIHLADKPPDTHHPFGHGRFEPIAGLQLGIFLSVLGCFFCYHQAVSALEEKAMESITPYAALIPLGAVLLLEIAYQRLKKVGIQQNSPALLADAVHYRIDGMSCLLAGAALSLGAWFPQHSHMLDHVGAFFISVLMIIVGVKAAWSNLHQILDRIPPVEYFVKVHQAAITVPGVYATEKLKIQSYGPDAHVSIDIEVDPMLTVEIAHAITQEVRLSIQLAWPAVRDVIVHVEPYYENDHSLPKWESP